MNARLLAGESHGDAMPRMADARLQEESTRRHRFLLMRQQRR